MGNLTFDFMLSETTMIRLNMNIIEEESIREKSLPYINNNAGIEERPDKNYVSTYKN